jgi:hypothetical protein
MAASVAYGLLGTILVWCLKGKVDAQLFFVAYNMSFKTVLSLGIILGTALSVFYGQHVIPTAIEKAFNKHLTDSYYYYRRRFWSLKSSLRLSAGMVVIAFVIFSYCQFPLTKEGEALILIATCAEYALAVYVLRKLLYSSLMLHSLLDIPVKRGQLQQSGLDAITPYILLTSTLTIVFLLIHTIGYYEGPFVFGSILSVGIKIFILYLPLIFVPLLLFLSFYSRTVLQKFRTEFTDFNKPPSINGYHLNVYGDVHALQQGPSNTQNIGSGIPNHQSGIQYRDGRPHIRWSKLKPEAGLQRILEVGDVQVTDRDIEEAKGIGGDPWIELREITTFGVAVKRYALGHFTPSGKLC